MKDRGSIWRKWDLHIHTPYTKLANEYKGESPEQIWGQFLQEIEESDIEAFGITDYFSVENYFVFLEKFQEKYPDSQKAFFPNIEFRTESKNSQDKNIQIHVIFSNKKKVLNKIETFLTRLELISTDDEDSTKKYCTADTLKEISYGKASVTFKTLIETLENNFSDSEYLIVGVANGYGALRPERNDGRGAEFAKELDKKSKLFFGNSNNTDFYLNKTGDGRSQYSLPPKAVISGSDCHSFTHINEKLGKPSNFTWIKADTTFEGLRQVVYEPEERVKIQEIKPEAKESYQIIDKVRFIDDAFDPEELPLNQNLTTIIGGKSTGKSLLLRNIAQTIDKTYVDNKLTEVNIEPYSSGIADFEVIWKDKQINRQSESTDVEKRIIYIPQSYLNRLVDKKEDKTPIDDIIKNVLEKEEKVKDAFEALEEKNRQLEKNLTEQIDNLFHKEEDISNSTDKIKKIGDKKGVEGEIKELKTEIKTLKEEAGLKAEEVKQFDEISQKYNILRIQLGEFKEDLETLQTLKLRENFFDVSMGNKNILDFLHSETHKNLSKSILLMLGEMEKQLNKVIDYEATRLKKNIEEGEKTLKYLSQTFAPLMEKAKKSQALEIKLKLLEQEESKLEQIKTLEKERETFKEGYNKLVKTIVDEHFKIFDNFMKAKEEILKQKSITESQNLEFDIQVIFAEKSFQENFINETFDQRKLGQFNKVQLQNYQYSANNFKNDIKEILHAILDDSLVIKSAYTKKEAITKLTKSWFTFDYTIQQDGDKISEMSPGKKSFVLLKLLIELDNSKCPILIDQPEDDLDNLSIYDDLVRFIKTKKKERQIIIVTHNPNLVVGTDSECVIVANQDGLTSKNNTYQFEYISGSLESEYCENTSKSILLQKNIQKHVCDILEGGKEAFEKRREKYHLK